VTASMAHGEALRARAWRAEGRFYRAASGAGRAALRCKASEGEGGPGRGRRVGHRPADGAGAQHGRHAAGARVPRRVLGLRAVRGSAETSGCTDRRGGGR
jgi:hypothetical protein